MRITLGDFFTGLFLALTLRGYQTFSVRQGPFDRAAEAAYNKLAEHAEANDWQLSFVIKCSLLHGVSGNAHDGIAMGTRSGIISLIGPLYQEARLLIPPEHVPRWLERLPLSHELYLELADTFLKTLCAPRVMD